MSLGKSTFDTWDKYWISPSGELIKLSGHHAWYATSYFKNLGIQNTAQDAMEEFLRTGWIRVQVHPDYVAMEGNKNKIEEYGDLAFDIKPDFQKVVFNFTDTGRYKQVYRDKVEGWSWNSIVNEASKGEI